MEPSGFPILSILIFLPLLGVLLIAFIDRDDEEAIRKLALSVTVANLVIGVLLYLGFDLHNPGAQFVEHIPWVASLGISYSLGLDGISLFLVILTTLLIPVALLASWTYIQDRVKEFVMAFLILETMLLGVFAAQDFVLFYIFWEGVLLPMFFIIGVWGGPRRIYAAFKFFLYTMSASVLMLIAIIVLYVLHYTQTGIASFHFADIFQTAIPDSWQNWLFWAFFLAFAVKVPLFPFHTWLPDAYVEAPMPGSAVLAGILFKMGGYGLVRFNLSLFPEATKTFAPFISVIALIGLIYGALAALGQRNLKRLIAYASVSHMGLVVFGMFTLTTQGVMGGLLQMLNHGLYSAGLFICVGMLYERRHTREIAEFGGLWTRMPVFGALFLILTFASIGLPGLNSFVSEFLILVGAFRSVPFFAVVAALGMVVGAVYMLWVFQRVMQGKITHEANRDISDINWRERWVLIPLIVVAFTIGLFPNLFLSRMESSVTEMLSHTAVAVVSEK